MYYVSLFFITLGLYRLSFPTFKLSIGIFVVLSRQKSILYIQTQRTQFTIVHDRSHTNLLQYILYIPTNIQKIIDDGLFFDKFKRLSVELRRMHSKKQLLRVMRQDTQKAPTSVITDRPRVEKFPDLKSPAHS